MSSSVISGRGSARGGGSSPSSSTSYDAGSSQAWIVDGQRNGRVAESDRRRELSSESTARSISSIATSVACSRTALRRAAHDSGHSRDDVGRAGKVIPSPHNVSAGGGPSVECSLVSVKFKVRYPAHQRNGKAVSVSPDKACERCGAAI